MCLRKSPTRTPAFLAANRANAARSTGPRTPQGKRASAWNALRHGYRCRAAWAAEPRDARDAEAFEAFMTAFRAAVIPVEGEAAERSLRERVAPLWRTKRLLDHWLSRHPWPLFQDDPVPPPFLSLVFPRRGQEGGLQWWIKVSVSVRWGRSPACMMIRDADPESEAVWLAWRSRRGTAHTVVTVTCTGHPRTRSHHQRLRTNPECLRKGVAWKNVVDDFEAGEASGERAPRDFGIMPASRPPATTTRAGRSGPTGLGAGNSWWTKIRKRVRALVSSRAHGWRVGNAQIQEHSRAKPECVTKQETCKNVVRRITD